MKESDYAIAIADLNQQHAAQLGDLFIELGTDPAARHFHPFPMTRDEAAHVTQIAAAGPDIYFGAFEGGRLAGFAMLRGWAEGYLIPSFGVAVGPGYRGRGIGRALLRHAIRRAIDRGATTVILKVHGNNPDARQLYESEGFVFDRAPGADGQWRGTLELETRPAS